MTLTKILSKSFKENNTQECTLIDVLNKRAKGLTRRDKEIIDAFVATIEEFNSDYALDREAILSTETAGNYFKNLLRHEQQEVLVALFLDSKNKPLKTKKVFKGTVNQSILHPREIFKEAVKYPTARIMLAHNHPSGDTRPSNADIEATQRLIECGELMGIEILDHIIVGHNSYLSLREKTMLFN